ncbi:MAG: DUF86 domain-containing protein [Bacteroidetes bacterium]|nr:DUF86 domain-containing protein [Bacteroidota bacterium]MBS1590529.1 DUF86 domain-containing protein [Bacteroidota bacterium]
MQTDRNKNKDLLYLLRILEAIGKIIFYAKSYNTAEDFIFSNHQKDYNASLLLLMQIGEQSVRISTTTKNNSPQINWQTIKNFRNRIAHDYVNIDKLIVFNIIKKDLPILQNQIEGCIKLHIEKNIFLKEELIISKSSIFYQHINFSKFE